MQQPTMNEENIPSGGRLPLEVLVMICEELQSDQPTFRTQRDQVNFGEASRRLHGAARRVHMQHVIVDTSKLRALLRYYFQPWTDHPPMLTTKILEVSSGPSRPVTNILDEQLLRDCEDIIYGHDELVLRQQDWLDDLAAGEVEALLAMLLMILLDLRELRLGNARLQDLAIFNRLFDEPKFIANANLHLLQTLNIADRPPVRYDWLRPSQWTKGYNDKVFHFIAPKLQSIELPHLWAVENGHSSRSTHPMMRVATLASFRSLKRLEAPYDALFSFPSISARDVDQTHILVEDLPPMLEMLVLTEVPRAPRFFRFLRLLLTRRESGQISTLSNVEVYWTRAWPPASVARSQQTEIESRGENTGMKIQFIDWPIDHDLIEM